MIENKWTAIRIQMKIFLSAINSATLNVLERRGEKMLWNLLSYYQFRTDLNLFRSTLARSELMMIDSGAHSFQKGKKVDWDAYTDEYARFIRDNDSPKIVGFFEMDVDNIIGYPKVLELRKKLEAVSDKIIPVWHKNRGVDDFKQMCKTYSGRTVAITGFANEDIKDAQYAMFLKYAWSCGVKVHCLGMTRRAVLDKVPFDYTDSASWKLNVTYKKVTLEGKTRYLKKQRKAQDTWAEIWANEYLEAKKMQLHYFNRWRKYDNQ